MLTVDRKFEILRPSLDRLEREALVVSNNLLVDPTSTSPLAIVDGEFLQRDSNNKWTRTVDSEKPSFACIDERGDYGPQGMKRLTCIVAGGSYLADTVLYTATSLVVGSKLMAGNITDPDGNTRSGLLLHTGANLIVGYVTRLQANNNGKLQFMCTLT